MTRPRRRISALIKLAALGAASFGFIASAPQMQAQDWQRTIGISLDSQAGYLADAYTNRKFASAGSGANSLGRADYRLQQAPIALTLRAQRRVVLSDRLPFELALSAALKWSSVKLAYPDGIGVLVDPLYLSSTSIGLELRAGGVMGRQSAWGRAEAGLGLNLVQSTDHFSFGTWRITEHREAAVPFGYLRYSHDLAAGAALFAETVTSTRGASIALGLDWSF